MAASRMWRMTGPGLTALKLETAAVPDPGPFEVLVRIGAVALNYRDRLTLDGLMPNLAFPCDPTSDAAGEVVAAGAQVTRFRTGDRVLAQIITNWIDGPGPSGPPLVLGGNRPGVLREYALFHEDAIIAAPASLDDVAAATLPGAGLAAWMALSETEQPFAGKTVLIEGTGGVSLFALQFAVASGMRAIAVLRDGEREAGMRALGAWRTVVAREADWTAEVVRLTQGAGVDQVIEVIGGANLERALGVLAPGGVLSLIGQLDRGPMSLPFTPVLRNRLRVQGIAIGSRRAFERMVRAIDANAIAPVIDSTFDFSEAPQAFSRLYQRPHGKVVIRVT